MVSASAWKNYVNAMMGGVGILKRPRALKPQNNTEEIQPRMMVTTFNGNPSSSIISYRSINVSDETDLIAFFN